MKKQTVVLISAFTLSFVGFFVFKTQQNPLHIPQDIRAALENSKVTKTIDGFVPPSISDEPSQASIPPHLKELNTEVLNVASELQEKMQMSVVSVSVNDEVKQASEAKAIVGRADALITKVNQQYNIDTSHINAMLSMAPVTSGNPEMQKFDAEQKAMTQELRDVEQMFQ